MAEKKTVKKVAHTSPSKKTGLRGTGKKAVEKAENIGGFAVIETGGKQYRVAVGDSIKIEKLISADKDGKKEYKEGSAITFDKVLLMDNGKGATDIGTPYLADAKVSGTLMEIGRHKKVTVIKYKSKSRYFKKTGHRQPYFKVKIEKIS